MKETPIPNSVKCYCLNIHMNPILNGKDNDNIEEMMEEGLPIQEKKYYEKYAICFICPECRGFSNNITKSIGG